MPPQQPDRPLDVLDQIFRFGAHGSSFDQVRLRPSPVCDQVQFDRRDLAIARLGCNCAVRLAATWRAAGAGYGQVIWASIDGQQHCCALLARNRAGPVRRRSPHFHRGERDGN
jgi:hypothetical protein